MIHGRGQDPTFDSLTTWISRDLRDFGIVNDENDNHQQKKRGGGGLFSCLVSFNGFVVPVSLLEEPCLERFVKKDFPMFFVLSMRK